MIDTVDASVSGQFFENLEECLHGRKLDAVVVNHMEPDHSATLGEVLRHWTEAAVHLMEQKFVMGAPLYWQKQELRHQGISLSWQTMSNWVLRAAEGYLLPVYKELQRQLARHELLTRDVFYADETPLQVLHEPSKTAQSNSYMWPLYRRSTSQPNVLYGTGRPLPERISERFQRVYLHTDGYKERPRAVIRPKGWLIVIFYSKLRKGWQTFLPNNAMTSV